MNNYVVATVKPWNIDAFHRLNAGFPGQWHLVSDPEGLTVGYLEELSPHYVFFPHWSWKVPASIHSRHECVCFHMTDVPYGRGGSPLQNLIARGHKETMISALQMVEDWDAGPVYCKIPLSLEGSAQHIFECFADKVYDIMRNIVENRIKPVPQEGEAVYFSKRKQVESLLPESGDMNKIHDHIRMLDAESYPHACLEYGQFSITFRNAQLKDGELIAEARITKKDAK